MTGQQELVPFVDDARHMKIEATPVRNNELTVNESTTNMTP